MDDAYAIQAAWVAKKASTGRKVIGWKIGVEGRKYQAGTAIFDEDGELCARARALWIERK